MKIVDSCKHKPRLVGTEVGGHTGKCDLPAPGVHLTTCGTQVSIRPCVLKIGWSPLANQ